MLSVEWSPNLAWAGERRKEDSRRSEPSMAGLVVSTAGGLLRCVGLQVGCSSVWDCRPV